MRDAIFSPYIVPVAAILGGVAYLGINAWRKVKEQELAQDRELRLKELELRANQSKGGGPASN
jgi:hypothetical protein